MKKLNMLLLPLILSGCAIMWLGAGAGIGIVGYKYINDKMEVTYHSSFNNVYEATKKTFRKLKIKIIKEYKDPIEATIEGKRLNGELVKIKIKNYGSNNIWVSIRVGILGDIQQSEVIKDKINYYIKNL